MSIRVYNIDSKVTVRQGVLGSKVRESMAQSRT